MELVPRADWFRFGTEHHTSQYSVFGMTQSTGRGGGKQNTDPTNRYGLRSLRLRKAARIKWKSFLELNEPVLKKLYCVQGM